VGEEGTVDDQEGRVQQADEALLDRLRAAAGRFDPVPADALLSARAALAHLRLDAELAELVLDSAVADRELAGVRSEAPAARQLTFNAGGLEVEVEILDEGDRWRLVGQCLPSGAVNVTVRYHTRERSAPRSAGATEATTDELGRFSAEVPSGPFSLRCAWPGTGMAVETSWVDPRS
jgi:hypothetical protein